ncbi:MAG: hypothetical protein EP329_21815 [Deltaproteobacteria bacterium]|nr:MAG: hypothetical protein EP329_21815 [Deltaproteobacteria bacterium]
MQPVAEVTPVRRAPDALLRPASEPPAFDLSRSELPRTRRYDDPGRWPVTAIVVSTLLAALLGGLIAMAATGG